MIIENSVATYAVLTMIITKGKKSLENMGRLINKSGDTVRRILKPGNESMDASQKVAQQVLANRKKLALMIDDTPIKKVHSRLIEGIFWLFDTTLGRSIRSYRILVGAVTDGKYTIPLNVVFSFGKEFYKDPKQAKILTVQLFIREAQRLFPGVIIVVVMDGAFVSVELLQWAITNKVLVEMRMASNRVVTYNGQKIKVRDIKKLRPRGRQMSRTIKSLWHDLSVSITAVRRINRHGEETIVYQISNYKAIPNEHAMFYKKRWGIEKMFRTVKQTLGLQECFSLKISMQYAHMCAVFLAYSMAQLEMKKQGYKNPEEAVRASEKQNHRLLNMQIIRLDQIVSGVYAYCIVGLPCLLLHRNRLDF